MPIVEQHAEEAAALCMQRALWVQRPDVDLEDLIGFDDRVDAQLDGLRVAEEGGWKLCLQRLSGGADGEAFAAGVLALESRSSRRLDAVLAVVQAASVGWRGLVAAFAWVSAAELQGVVRGLLQSPGVFERRLGLAACRVHGIDPGRTLDALLGDPNATLRASAFRTAGDLGRIDLLGRCRAGFDDPDLACRLRAARSAVALGDRGAGLTLLLATLPCLLPSERREALSWGLLASDPQVSRAALRAWSEAAHDIRLLVEAAGLSGDPHYVPWLIEQTAQPSLARLAGDALDAITGVCGSHPAAFSSAAAIAGTAGPDDDPDHHDVAVDDDLGLRWPDPVALSRWWASQQMRFASGVRYFVGRPPQSDHCTVILVRCGQRRRAAAARLLCLSRPGRAVFDTTAVGWRQRRRLAQAAPHG